MNPASWIDSRDWLAVGWTMLHFLWIGGLAGVLAAALLSALSRSGPRVRYAVSLGMLLAIAALPVGLFVVGRAEFQGTTNAAALDAQVASSDDAATMALPPLSENPPSPAPPSLRSSLGDASGKQWLTLAYRGLPWLWIVGTPLTLLILTCGLYGAERLRRSARLLEDGEVAAACRRLRSTLRIGRNVAVAVCERVAVPVLVGVIRPMILLPPAILTGCSPAQIEMILIHELAHVRRWDLLVNLIQRLIEAALFFHPVIWWLSSRVRLEREECCDAVVLEQTGAPQAYAETLASIALPGLGAPQAAVAFTNGHLVIRIRHILDLEEETMNVSRKALLTVAGVAVLAAGATAWHFRSPQAASSDVPPVPLSPETATVTIHADDDGRLTSVYLGREKVFDGPVNDTNLEKLHQQLRSALRSSLRAAQHATVQLMVVGRSEVRDEDRLKILHICSEQRFPDGSRLSRTALSTTNGNPELPGAAGGIPSSNAATNEGGLKDAGESAANSAVITIQADNEGNLSSVHLGGRRAFDGPANDLNLAELDRLLALHLLERAPEQTLIRFHRDLRYPDLMKVVEVCARQRLPNGSRLNRITFVESTGDPESEAAGDAAHRPVTDVGRPARPGRSSDPGYLIEPPDVLAVEVSSTVRSAVYKLQPGDELLIRGSQLLPIDPQGDPVLNGFKQINGPFTLQPDGTVDLGPEYGSVRLAGLAIKEARLMLVGHLTDEVGLRDPKIAVSFPNVNVPQTVRGEHLVRPDGTISLGTCGTLYVAGMSLGKAQAALEKHLAQFFHNPVVTLRVTAMNSKSVYLIRKQGKTETIAEFPFTGHETVLDILNRLGGVVDFSSQRIRVARANPNPGGGVALELPVDWKAITNAGDTATNHMLRSGDRIYMEPGS